MITSPRQKAFLEDYAQSSSIRKSAVKAGYSQSYADKMGKRLVNGAIRSKALDIIAQVDNKPMNKEEAKELLCEVIGIDRELLTDTLKKIALQDKDYSSAIKILSPLAKEAIGLDISQQEQQNITVPVLNIVVDKPQNEAIQGVIKEVEP